MTVTIEPAMPIETEGRKPDELVVMRTNKGTFVIGPHTLLVEALNHAQKQGKDRVYLRLSKDTGVIDHETGEEMVLRSDVTRMIEQWQAECNDYPAMHNQGNVLLNRLDALASPPPASSSAPQGVEVRTLDWRELTSPREDGPQEPTGDIEAVTMIGEYSVCVDEDAVADGGPDWKWCVWTPVESLGHFGDLEEAKAAAQADYRARILAAIQTSPEAGDGVGNTNDGREDSQP